MVTIHEAWVEVRDRNTGEKVTVIDQMDKLYDIYLVAVITANSGEYIRYDFYMVDLNSGRKFDENFIATERFREGLRREKVDILVSILSGEIIARLLDIKNETNIKFCVKIVQPFRKEYCTTVQCSLITTCDTKCEQSCEVCVEDYKGPIIRNAWVEIESLDGNPVDVLEPGEFYSFWHVFDVCIRSGDYIYFHLKIIDDNTGRYFETSKQGYAPLSNINGELEAGGTTFKTDKLISKLGIKNDTTITVCVVVEKPVQKEFCNTKIPLKIKKGGDECQTVCESSCQEACETTCETECEKSCESLCEKSCEESCEVTCQETCEKSCQQECEATCEETCEVTCQEVCEQQCQVKCEKSCEQLCELYCEEACEKTCEASCERQCQIGCQISCEQICESVCQTVCEEACETACEETCQQSCELNKQALMDNLTYIIADFFGVSFEQARAILIGLIFVAVVVFLAAVFG